MKPRKVILFKVNGLVVVEEHQDLTVEQVEQMKWVVAEEIEVPIFDVEVEYQEQPLDLSDDIDCASDENGKAILIFYKSLSFSPIVGVECPLVEGSDEYLDAILDGTILNHLNFFI